MLDKRATLTSTYPFEHGILGNSINESGEGPNEEESETNVSLEGAKPQMSGKERARRDRDEVPKAARREEASTATHVTERSGASELMEAALERRNLQLVLKRVKKNKGSAGIDGMTGGSPVFC